MIKVIIVHQSVKNGPEFESIPTSHGTKITIAGFDYLRFGFQQVFKSFGKIKEGLALLSWRHGFPFTPKSDRLAIIYFNCIFEHCGLKPKTQNQNFGFGCESIPTLLTSLGTKITTRCLSPLESK